MQETALDDLDRRLIHALQLRPRASWTALGVVLGVDPATLLRRWRRLRDSGSVYVTTLDAASRATPLAFVEIGCQPALIRTVADAMAQDPAVLNIDVTASGRQLLLLVVGSSLEALNRWVTGNTTALTGLTALRTQLVADLVLEASVWRLRSLTAPELAALATPSAAAAQAPQLRPDERAALLEALTIDFRAPVSGLAQDTGIPVRRIREVLHTLDTSGQLIIRIDVARRLTPWPVHCWYYLRTPASMLDTVADRLARMDEIRAVAKTVGDYNLMTSFWLRGLSDLQRLEGAIETHLPTATIVDRTVVTRAAKHVGYLLDDDGFATRGRVRVLPC